LEEKHADLFMLIKAKKVTEIRQVLLTL